jgi:hypothetical protein
MTNALLSPVLHDIHVNVVSPEEASWGVAESLHIEPGSAGLALGAHALAEAIAEANRLLDLH